jgi:hypothetical protein
MWAYTGLCINWRIRTKDQELWFCCLRSFVLMTFINLLHSYSLDSSIIAWRGIFFSIPLCKNSPLAYPPSFQYSQIKLIFVLFMLILFWVPYIKTFLLSHYDPIDGPSTFFRKVDITRHCQSLQDPENRTKFPLKVCYSLTKWLTP